MDKYCGGCKALCTVCGSKQKPESSYPNLSEALSQQLQSVGTARAQTGWVDDPDSGKGSGGGGGGKRKASFSGDGVAGAASTGSSGPGSPSSAFTIPKRKKVRCRDVPHRLLLC